MAYRKRLKIAKGLHFNLSSHGGGLGLRLFPGLSFSVNSKGLYCNTSLPGTGFYSRHRISGTTRQSCYSTNSSGIQSNEFELKLSCDDETGIVTLQVYNSLHNEVYDPAIINRIKKSDVYKNALNTLILNTKNNIEEKTEEFIDIYKMTASPLTKTEVQNLIDNVVLEKYSRSVFTETSPQKEEVLNELKLEAKRKFNSILFWKNSKNRKQFIEEEFPKRFDAKYSDWEERKTKFETNEFAIEKHENARYQKEYDEKIKSLNSLYNTDKQSIEDSISELISHIELPVSFYISYEYDEENRLLFIDLDLPEIEDYPNKKASILSSGKLSIKSKTKTELNSDYAKSVTGLAFFFTGMFFNVSVAVENICVSGYTQRLDSSIGKIRDQYVYSILFNRQQFRHLSFACIDPLEAFKKFPNRIDVKSYMEMKEISPFNIEESKNLINSCDISHVIENEIYDSSFSNQNVSSRIRQVTQELLDDLLN